MNNERKRADAPINLEHFPIATEMQILKGKCFGELFLLIMESICNL